MRADRVRQRCRAKTRLLLEHLESPRAYLPIDVARGPLERSALELAGQFPGLRVLPVHADFTAPLTLPDTGNRGARRVVYFPGSTIGNFSPRRPSTSSARSPGSSARAVVS